MGKILNSLLKVNATLAICIPHSTSTVCAQGSGRIAAGIFNAVVQIKTPIHSIGIGFLAKASEDNSDRTFLVTNKHMIGTWKCPGDELTQTYDWIDVDIYRNGDPKGRVFKASRIMLKDAKGQLDKRKVFVSEDKSVDVVAIDVDRLIRDPEENIVSSVFAPSYMVRFEDIEKQLSGVGDLVFALGYPRGISSLVTNHPLAKAAYLASIPGEEISIPDICGAQPDGQPRTVTVKGKLLIVDGLIQHGNSGSRVLHAGGAEIRHDPKTGQIEFSNVDIKNFVCGIVSFEVWGPDLQPGSGLTAVYSSDYILDLLASATNETTPHPKK